MKCRVACKSMSFDVDVRPACGITGFSNLVVLPGHFLKMSNFILSASFKTQLFCGNICGLTMSSPEFSFSRTMNALA